MRVEQGGVVCVCVCGGGLLSPFVVSSNPFTLCIFLILAPPQLAFIVGRANGGKDCSENGESF